MPDVSARAAPVKRSKPSVNTKQKESFNLQIEEKDQIIRSLNKQIQKYKIKFEKGDERNVKNLISNAVIGYKQEISGKESRIFKLQDNLKNKTIGQFWFLIPNWL